MTDVVNRSTENQTQTPSSMFRHFFDHRGRATGTARSVWLAHCASFGKLGFSEGRGRAHHGRDPELLDTSGSTPSA